MFRVLGIKVQSLAIPEPYYQPGIERTVKMQDVGPDIEAMYAIDNACECRQPVAVQIACSRISFWFIFPTDYMDQHILD
jgi:hypothetical protein